MAERTAELRRTTAEAIAAQQRFRALVDTLEGIVWEADAQTFAFSFVSSQAEHILDTLLNAGRSRHSGGITFTRKIATGR